MTNSVRVKDDGKVQEFTLERPAPRVVRGELVAHVEGKGRRRFPLAKVIGWVFGGSLHCPDDRR